MPVGPRVGDTLSPSETAPFEINTRVRVHQGKMRGLALLAERGVSRTYENERILGRPRGGTGSILFAQTATDRPGIDLQQLCGAQTIATRILQDRPDDRVMDFPH